VYYIASVKRDEMCGRCLISEKKEDADCRERYSSRERNAEGADCLAQTTRCYSWGRHELPSCVLVRCVNCAYLSLSVRMSACPCHWGIV